MIFRVRYLKIKFFLIARKIFFNYVAEEDTRATASTYKPINLSTHQPINPSTYQPINPSTHQPINL